MVMDGEISTFIMVWASILASVLYCYAVSRIATKGLARLIMFLPVIYLFIVLPFNLTSVHLGCPTVFFISWLANTKLLLLASGNGPLSHPSLTTFPFVLLTCLPIKLQENNILKQPQSTGDEQSHINGSPNEEQLVKSHTVINPRRPSHIANRAIILATLVWLAQWRDHWNRTILLFCVTTYIYVGVDLMLSILAFIAGLLLGKKVEAPFNDPFLSTSLRDFWGRRWNRVASENLRSAVYRPIYHYSSRKMSLKWARVQALVATFLVSALLHELLMYYLGRTMPSCRSTKFFLFHGLCLVVEGAVKKKFSWRKWPALLTSQHVIGPLIFGFAVMTAMWLLVEDALDYNVDARVVEESTAFVVFMKDLGVVLIRKLAL